MTVLTWIVNNILSQASLFMALIAAAGLIVQKKKATEVLEGAITTAVGQIVFSGASTLIATPVVRVNNILMPMIASSAGISLNADNVQAFAQGVEWVGTNIMPIFIISWFIHIVLVKVFSKYLKVVYLTVHTMLNLTAVDCLFFYGFMGFRGPMVYIPCIIINVLYWTLSPMLSYKASMEITDGSFALGHFNQIGCWLATLIAPKLGDAEKDDADNMNLPGWLQMFSSVTLNVAITMPTVFIIIGIIVLIGGNAECLATMQKYTAGQNWIIWFILQGFSLAGGVVVLLTGLRMFLGAIIPAFQGFTEKIIPGCAPAVDLAAFFGYSPMGGIFGFLGYALATILVSICCGLFQAPVFVYPATALAFFDGGVIGVFANKKGGWKAALICGFLGGAIMTVGGGIVGMYVTDAAANGIGFSNFDGNFMLPIIYTIFSLFKG